MRLPDFTADPDLIALRRSMGADVPGSFTPSYQPGNLTLTELEQLATDGKDVSIDDVVVLEDSTLSYKERRVLIYIRDISQFQHWVPRFHIADCETLQQMKQRNAFGRYVVATRDDGLFVVNMIGKGGQVTRTTERLDVCQNCLNKLGFDGFSRDLVRHRRRLIVSEFTIRRFFEQFPKSLFSARPAGAAETAPVNNYPSDFEIISERLRTRRSWTCESCDRSFALLSDRKFLHVHHKDGIKYNSTDQNLRVLCLGCHANEPLHAHMKRLPEYREFLRRFGEC
jgi:hypothetical protein